MRPFTTRDIGLAIRDFLEGQEIHQFDDDMESAETATIEFVDVSDPNNPVIVVDNGKTVQTFTVRIFI